MKRVLNLVEQYLKKHPSPTSISLINNIIKLQYTYSNPYIDAKTIKQRYLSIQNINTSQINQSLTKTLNYNDKGYLTQSNSFDGITSKDKHQKLMQDDVFGKASHNHDYSRWLYVAQVKQDPIKSYFNQGKGKAPFKYDFGQTYQGIKQVGIFLWDKNTKKIFRIQLQKDLIPSYPSFLNAQSSQIIFHAYKKQNFGYGILHCFNRPVSIYKATLKIEQSQKINEKGVKETNIQLKCTKEKLIQDNEQTNIAPLVSKDYNYILYFSGTGITHTYYLDLVIIKRQENGWLQHYRIKQFFVGYYNHLKSFAIQYQGKQFAIVQTQQKSTTRIYRINLQTGQKQNLTKNHQNYDFSLSEISLNNTLFGTVCTNNFNSFFYFDKQINILQPLARQQFIQTQINQPFHAILVQAKPQNIHEDYKERLKQRPFIVFPHGGPHGSFSQALTLLRYILLKMGYCILHPNPPASIGYGQKFINQSLTKIGQYDSSLIVQMIQKIIQQRQDIDKKRIHSHGGSYGGYLSAIFGSRYSNLFTSVVILNGVINNIANMWFTDIPEWVTAQTVGHKNLHSLTQQDYKQMWKQSPISKPLKCPTLQFLGAKDQRVPHRQGLLYDAITKDIGTPITTYVYQNSGHSLADSVQTSIDIIVKTILFLENIQQQDQIKNK